MEFFLRQNRQWSFRDNKTFRATRIFFQQEMQAFQAACRAAFHFNRINGPLFRNKIIDLCGTAFFGLK